MMLRAWTSLFYPPCCLTCSEALVEGEQWLCTVCCYRLLSTDYHQHADNIVAERFYGRIPLKHVTALYHFRKAGYVQKMIYYLKYRQQPGLGQWLGQICGSKLLESHDASTFDLIIPVPLHKLRVKQRGYNQSDYFAKGLSASLGVAWNGRCLVRTQHTPSQVSKHQLERHDNVAGAFCVIDPAVTAGKQILLVDDVLTTGATLEACGKALLAAGADSISIATIAVAV